MSSHWAIQQLVAPVLEPVSLAEAKAHVRQDQVDDDDLISALIVAARTEAERYTQRQFAPATFRLTLDRFPWWELAGWRAGRLPYLPAWQWAEHLPIHLPKPPLQSISSLVYTDANGVQQTMDPTLYQVDTNSQIGRVQPAYAQYWPITRAQLNAVQIVYVAGWSHSTVAASIAAGTQTVTPADMTGINAGETIQVDVGKAREVVTVASVTSTTFTATFARSHGAGTVVSRIPIPIKQAILLLVAHWYQNREAVNDKPLSPMPLAFEALLGSWWTGEYQ